MGFRRISVFRRESVIRRMSLSVWLNSVRRILGGSESIEPKVHLEQILRPETLPCVGCRCDTLKLAMLKNQHLASKLFNGKVYDCVCQFEEGVDTAHSRSPAR